MNRRPDDYSNQDWRRMPPPPRESRVVGPAKTNIASNLLFGIFVAISGIIMVIMGRDASEDFIRITGLTLILVGICFMCVGVVKIILKSKAQSKEQQSQKEISDVEDINENYRGKK